MIPDHIRYGSPEECRDALSRPMRYLSDSRWLWATGMLHSDDTVFNDIDEALEQRVRQMKQVLAVLPAIPQESWTILENCKVI